MAECKISKLEVLEAFRITDGNIMQSADLLGVIPQTIYNYLAEDEDLKNKLYASRRGKYIRRCDISEGVIDRLHQMVEDRPGYAFQAAKFYLETHGKDRNYGLQQSIPDIAPNESKIIAFTDNMILKDEIAQLKEKLSDYESKTRQEPEGSDAQV